MTGYHPIAFVRLGQSFAGLEAALFRQLWQLATLASALHGAISINLIRVLASREIVEARVNLGVEGIGGEIWIYYCFRSVNAGVVNTSVYAQIGRNLADKQQ
ncbi:hypothetical protein Ancab_033647 [Ancistrocladus abbreviatus]